MLKIITVPNPILRQKSKPVAKIDHKVADFIDDLSATLIHTDNPKGVGLSAPQVGKLWRIFITLLDGKLTTFINPEIIAASKQLTLNCNRKRPFLEGCLSIPKTYGPVWRHTWVKLKWQMMDGTWQQTK